MAGLAVAAGDGDSFCSGKTDNGRQFHRVGGEIDHRDTGVDGCYHIGQVRKDACLGFADQLLYGLITRRVFEIAGCRQQINQHGSRIRVAIATALDIGMNLFDLLING